MTELIRALRFEELVARGAPRLFTTDPAEWKAKLVDWFENDPDGPRRKLYPAQVEMVLIDMLSYAFGLLGEEAQFAAEQRWLAFALGAHADLLAANNSTFRLAAARAVTTLQFTLAAAQPGSVIVPAGTRVAAASGAVFATDADLVFGANTLAGEVAATAVEAGIAANGLQPGSISALVDPVGVGMSVTNLTASEGGADEETTASLVARAAQAHERISKAGGRESYRQRVMKFSAAILDVAVVRPEPGVIHIYPLTEEGAAGSDVREAIAAWLDPDVYRPQGDDVSVLEAEPVTFSVTLTVRGRGDLQRIRDDAELATIAVATPWRLALAAYISPAAISCAVRAVAGVVDVDVAIAGLADRQIPEQGYAVLTGVIVEMEGA